MGYRLLGAVTLAVGVGYVAGMAQESRGQGASRQKAMKRNDDLHRQLMAESDKVRALKPAAACWQACSSQAYSEQFQQRDLGLKEEEVAKATRDKCWECLKNAGLFYGIQGPDQRVVSHSSR